MYIFEGMVLLQDSSQHHILDTYIYIHLYHEEVVVLHISSSDSVILPGNQEVVTLLIPPPGGGGGGGDGGTGRNVGERTCNVAVCDFSRTAIYSKKYRSMKRRIEQWYTTFISITAPRGWI